MKFLIDFRWNFSPFSLMVVHWKPYLQAGVSIWMTVMFLLYIQFLVSLSVTTKLSYLVDGAYVDTFDIHYNQTSMTRCTDVWTCNTLLCDKFATGMPYVCISPLPGPNLTDRCHLNTSSAYSVAASDDTLSASTIVTDIILYAQVVLFILGMIRIRAKWLNTTYMVSLTLSKLLSFVAAGLYLGAAPWLNKEIATISITYGSVILLMLFFANCADLIWTWLDRRPRYGYQEIA